MKPIHDKLRTRNPSAALFMLAGLCALLIIHLSLYPYSGWRDIGIGPFEFLSGEWVPVHQRLLWVDIGFNVLAYVPLGFLATVGILHFTGRKFAFLAVISCALLSLGLESLQTWLPSRVPSKMDLLTNCIGGFIGFLLGSALLRREFSTKPIEQQLDIWLVQKAWLGMGLLCLWLFSLIAPQFPDFVTGYWLGNLLGELGIGPETLIEGWSSDTLLMVEIYAPTLANYCFLMCAWSLGLAQTHTAAPRIRLILLLGLLTIMLRIGFRVLDTEAAEWWESLGHFFEQNSAVLALALCVTLILALRRVPSHWNARIALFHLIVGWGLTLLLPGLYDPEMPEQMFGFEKIQLSLMTAAQWIGEFWPVLAIGVLVFLSKREHHFAR